MIPERPSTRAASAVRRVALLAALASSATLAACEGSNLFERGGAIDVGGNPVVISLTADSPRSPGDSVTVHVVALGRRGLDSIRVVFSGAAEDTSVIRFDPAREDTVRAQASVRLPDPVPVSQLQVRAIAIDETGNTSTEASTVVSILSPAILKPEEAGN